MTHDEMVEKVARGLNAICYDGCEDGDAGFRACIDPPCHCRAAARAATAIVLEEAAKVADEHVFGGAGVAAAIRAMMEDTR